jgi:hypothetical protein
MINYSIGGSERKYAKDVRTLRDNEIKFKQVGLVSLGSMKILIRVSSEHEALMKSLGFSKTRNQWD